MVVSLNSRLESNKEEEEEVKKALAPVFGNACREPSLFFFVTLEPRVE